MQIGSFHADESEVGRMSFQLPSCKHLGMQNKFGQQWGREVFITDI